MTDSLSIAVHAFASCVSISISVDEGPLHMDKQRQDDLLKPTYSSSVPIDLLEAVDNRERLRERVRDICADSAT